MILPKDIIEHCQKYLGCKGCPLKTCEAPHTEITDPRWYAWMESRIKAVRALT